MGVADGFEPKSGNAGRGSDGENAGAENRRRLPSGERLGAAEQVEAVRRFAAVLRPGPSGQIFLAR